MPDVSRAKLIDDLVVMYDITKYQQLEKVHAIIDGVIGKGNDAISVQSSGKIIAQMDQSFNMRAPKKA